MPHLDRVQEEILKAAMAAFRAHGWEVFTHNEINSDDLPRFS